MYTHRAVQTFESNALQYHAKLGSGNEVMHIVKSSGCSGQDSASKTKTYTAHATAPGDQNIAADAIPVA